MNFFIAKILILFKIHNLKLIVNYLTRFDAL